MAIRIEFLSKISQFLKGTDNMGDALDDVADSLDDVARDAQRAGDMTGDAFDDAARDAKRAGDKIGDGFKDGTKDAEQGVERLERSFKDLADTARRESDQAGDSMKREFDSSTDAAKRDLSELGDEAKQNLSETLSSFDGSVESMADGIQGTLGGVISNIGPLGAGAAVGLALITAEFQRGTERAAEMKEQAGELAQQIIDAGGDISKVPMSDVLQEWALELSGTSEAWDIFGDKTQTNLEALAEGAKEAGLELGDVFNALADSNPEQAADLIDDLAGKLAKLKKAQANMAAGRMGGTERAAENAAEIESIEDMIQVMEDRTGINREATDSARELGGALEEQRAKEQALAAAEQARADASNALQSELDEGVSSWQEYIDVETGAADPGAYIAAMEQRVAATSNFNTNVSTLASDFGLSQAEMQAILDQGLEFAPMLQSIIDSGMAPQFIAQIQAAVGGGQELIDGNPLVAPINAEASTDSARADLNQTASEERTAGIGAQADTRRAERDLNATASKRRVANITARAYISTAAGMLDRLSRPRAAVVNARAMTWAAENAIQSLTRPRTVQITADVRTREGKRV